MAQSLIVPEGWQPKAANELGQNVQPDKKLRALDVAQRAAPTLGIDTRPLDLAQRGAPFLGIDLTAHRTADTPAKGEDITAEHEALATKAAPLLGINPMISQAPQESKARPFGKTYQGTGEPVTTGVGRVAGAILGGARANEPLGMGYAGPAEQETQRAFGYGTPQYHAAETVFRPIATIGDLISRVLGGAIGGAGQLGEEAQRALAGEGEAVPGAIGRPEQLNAEIQNLLGMKLAEGPGARAKAPGVDYPGPRPPLEGDIMPPRAEPSVPQLGAPGRTIEGEPVPTRAQGAQAAQREAQRVKQEMFQPTVEEGGQAQPVQGWQAKPPKDYSRDVPPPKTAPLPDITSLRRPESDWHQRVTDLDARNAPDEAYRNILQTGAKEIQKNGGPQDALSWRDKVVGYINKAATTPVDPAHDLARQAAPQLGVPPPEATRPAEPPVQPGMIRYYHGTTFPDATGFTGKTFVSPQYEYARNYGAGNRNVLFTDLTKEEATKRGLYDDINGFPRNGSIDDGAARLRPLEQQAPFTASPPPPAAAQAASGGLPPPGMPPTAPPPGAPPPAKRGAPTPPFQSGEAPANFLDNAPDITTGPMHPARIREMENDLFATKSADRGRKEIMQTQTLPRIQKALARTFGRDAAKVDKKLYHDIENGRPIDPTAQRYYDQTIQPRRDANLNKWRELQTYNMPDLEAGVENPDYMHRMRIGKTKGMDVASGADEASLAGTVGYGKGKLSTMPSAARKRTILAMEDEAGNRKIIEALPGNEGVFVWENGKRRAEPGGLIRTTEERFTPGEVKPGRTTLEKPVVAKVKEGGLTDPYYKPSKEIPDRVTQDRVTEPKLVNDKFRKGSEFVDQNKKRWFIKDATTEEIHNAGVRDISRKQVAPGQFRISYGEPIRFYESALASVVMNGLELDKAIAMAKFRQKWQEAPEFKTHSVAAADASPEQRRNWEQIKAPGWEGRYYEPTFAEPIIDHLVGQGYRVPIVDRASNFATRWLFRTGIGSIAHGWNEAFQRMLARGVTGNLNVVARSATALKAFSETMNKGPIWQDYRNKGASFPSDGMHGHTVEHDIMRTLGMRLAKEPGFIATAKRWALAPNELLKIWEHAIGKAVFEYGDFIALQHGLELERRGFTREQAILRMNRVLPTYRIPSRIIGKGQGARFAARMMASPSFAQFGPFTYARFKALSSIVEDIAGKGKSWRDRRDGLDRLIGAVLVFAFVAPFVDKKLREASGDKNMHFLWGGSLGMISRAIRMADDVREGRKSGTDAVLDGLTSSVNLSAFIKESIQQYSGRDLYNDRQFVAPTDPDMQSIAERASHLGSTFFAPTQAFTDPKQYFFEDPMRLSTSRPFDPRPFSRSGAKRAYSQEQGRLERLPGPVQEGLRLGRKLYQGFSD